MNWRFAIIGVALFFGVLAIGTVRSVSPAARATPTPDTPYVARTLIPPDPTASSTVTTATPVATPTLAPTPTVAPTPTPTVAPTPAPVAYQVQTRSDFSVGGRKRTGVNVIVPGTPTKEQVIATLAAIARAELGAADVVVVRAWRSAADQAAPGCVTFTVGAAELSADGRGWAQGQSVGGATLLFGPDNGQIQGEVELPPLDRTGCPTKKEQFTVAR